MVIKTVEKTVVIARDGTPLSVMERPNGLGTFEDYHRKVQNYRRQYAHLLNSQSFNDFLKERKEELDADILTGDRDFQKVDTDIEIKVFR